jgi:hypothetical protein
LIGLGIFRDTIGNPTNMADIIPVDIVSRQILLSIPYCVESRKPLLVTHCASSSLNPVTWSNFFANTTKYMNNFPYEKRVGPASFTLHKSEASFMSA